MSDLHAAIASTTGKIELEAMGDAQEDRVVDKLIQGAILTTFNRHFSARDFDDLVLGFENGLTVETSDMMPTMEYVHQVSHMDGMREAASTPRRQRQPGCHRRVRSSSCSKDLHLNRRLNKDRSSADRRHALSGVTPCHVGEHSTHDIHAGTAPRRSIAFDADAIMDAISDDVLSDGDLNRALQRLFRWGAQSAGRHADAGHARPDGAHPAHAPAAR